MPAARPFGAVFVFPWARGGAMTLAFDTAMDRFRPALPLGVALSGGADSTALLHACAQRWPGAGACAARAPWIAGRGGWFRNSLPGALRAAGVPLRIARVDARHAGGESPEDAARQRRYEALRDLAGGQQGAHQAGTDGVMPEMEAGQGGPGGDGDPDRPAAGRPVLASVALAQHADDQVETVLLALSRGAGWRGSPPCRPSGGGAASTGTGRCWTSQARTYAPG